MAPDHHSAFAVPLRLQLGTCYVAIRCALTLSDIVSWGVPEHSWGGHPQIHRDCTSLWGTQNKPTSKPTIAWLGSRHQVKRLEASCSNFLDGEAMGRWELEWRGGNEQCQPWKKEKTIRHSLLGMMALDSILLLILLSLFTLLPLIP